MLVGVRARVCGYVRFFARLLYVRDRLRYIVWPSASSRGRLKELVPTLLALLLVLLLHSLGLG